MTYNLNERAEELFKDEYLQTKWIEAIQWLRSSSRKGWILDSSGRTLES